MNHTHPADRPSKTELALLRPVDATVLAIPAALDVLAAFLAGRNPRTLRAYDRDLEDFSWFAGARDARHGVAWLLGLEPGHANAVAFKYKAHLVERGLKSATINRSLAALRSVVKMARLLGVVTWELGVENRKAAPYRDTKGPGRDGWQAMLDHARARVKDGGPRPVRDLAIIRLLHDLALRRGELVALDVADVDMDARTVAVVGKGRTDKDPLTMPDPTVRALVGWLDVRGREPGPLFVPLYRPAPFDGPGRLTDTSVYRLVRDLGEQAGLTKPVRPHGLRHEAITRALIETNGNVRDVQLFSRHASVETVLIYDDRGKDKAGVVAKLVAGD
jgi:integrase/recombinase XerC